MIVAVVIAYNLSRLQLNPSPPPAPPKIKGFKGIRIHGLCVHPVVLYQLSYEEPHVWKQINLLSSFNPITHFQKRHLMTHVGQKRFEIQAKVFESHDSAVATISFSWRPNLGLIKEF